MVQAAKTKSPASMSRTENYARLIEGAVSQAQDGKVPRLGPSAFKSLEDGYSLEELYRLVAPKRTLMRRKASDALLTRKKPTRPCGWRASPSRRTAPSAIPTRPRAGCGATIAR